MNQLPHPIQIDRLGRDEMVLVLKQWLAGQLNAGQVLAADEKTYAKHSKLPRHQRDTTLIDIFNELIYEFEDEPYDVTIQLDRDIWNYAHRLILLLTSDASLIDKIERRWHWSCFVSAVGLLGYVALWIGLGGLDGEWLLSTLPFALIAGPIWWWRDKEQNRWSPDNEKRCLPFASYSQMMQVRRRVTNFHKRPYVEVAEGSSHIETDIRFKAARKCWTYVRDNFEQLLFYCYLVITFIVASPLMLLLAISPLSKSTPQLHWPVPKP